MIAGKLDRFVHAGRQYLRQKERKEKKKREEKKNSPLVKIIQVVNLPEGDAKGGDDPLPQDRIQSRRHPK